jgi:Flp pilus assembly protein TadG
MRRSVKRQHGVVAIIAALCLLVFMGIAGLAIDMGRLFVIKAELQGAADSCVLSAARELDGKTDSLQRAINAGVRVAVRNDVDLQSTAVQADASSITFSTQIDGPYVSAGSIKPTMAKYVKCTPYAVSANTWFMKVAGITSRTVTAEAVARLSASQASCAVPVALCTTQTVKHAPSPNWGLTAHNWYQGLVPPNQTQTGNYNWIDFTPPLGGADELMGLIAGTGSCNVPVSGQVGQSGYNSGLVDAWNTRFGLYKGSYSLTQNRPDWTGFTYTTTSWPAGQNAFADFNDKRLARATYQGNAASGISLVGNPTVSTSWQHGEYGADRRLAIVPIIRCSEWVNSQLATMRDWACVLLLNPINTPSDVVMEFLGFTNDANSPCATAGVPGGTGSGGPLVPTLVQ